MKKSELTYFLFPHMTLSAGDLRNLCILLPRLNLLEIVRQADVPAWAQERVSGWPVLTGEDISSRISSCIAEYRNFAQVHGGPGGMLGFLSRVFDEVDEKRYKIQEELRGKCAPDMDSFQKEIIQASLFLEMARELDEKELEIESSYAHLNAIEQEFRQILGIDDDASERAETNLTPALEPDTSGLLYMLPRRIESWFRVLSLRQPEGISVFVSNFPEVIDEVMEMIRVGCERNGKKFSASIHSLGSIPRLGGLGSKQFQTLIEAPGMAETLSSCYSILEEFVKSAAGGIDAPELEAKSPLVQSCFEKLCRKCEASETDMLNLSLTVVESIVGTDIPGLGGFMAGEWSPVFINVSARR